PTRKAHGNDLEPDLYIQKNAEVSSFWAHSENSLSKLKYETTDELKVEIHDAAL
ncbi:hypothetical protein L914_10515, partial [Phytophthora nicotianae]